MTIRHRVRVLTLFASSFLAAFVQADETAAPTASPHQIGAVKLIVNDLAKTQAFYETFFGMKEVAHFRAEGVYDEPILGLASGARLALFQPKAEAPLTKPRAPVALIYTPDFDALIQRIEAAKHPLYRLSGAESGAYKIAIVRDPSDNAIEIFARADKPMEIGGAKLIVGNRLQAETFYTRVLGLAPLQRFTRKEYDEVIMGFGAGAFLALFEPKNEQPLPKSKFPVVAIYTTQFDAIVKRLDDDGVKHREVKSSTPGQRITVATDPAGNAVEFISR